MVLKLAALLAVPLLTLGATTRGRQVAIDQPPRLRTMLPNGALVLIDRVPHAKTLVVDLFVSSRGTEETPQTHGRRHLMEHLVALGKDEDLDRRLETAGGFLRAETLRDSMVFEMTLPPDGLKLGLAAIKELATDSVFTDAAIAREAAVIAEEGALREPTSLASETAWAEAFGLQGLDPFGDLEIIKATTSEQLKALHRRSFAANHLAVVVSGDVDLDAATRTVSEVVSFLPAMKGNDASPPLPAKDAAPADVAGEYRAVPVRGYRAPASAATLAAALALASQLSNGTVVYTPSARPGMVILGNPGGTLREDVAKADPAALFDLGRALASRWVRARLAEPADAATFRGMLLVRERDLKPEAMLENLETLPYTEFKQAFDAFQGKGLP